MQNESLYEPDKLLIDTKGNVLKVIYENDIITVKTPKEVEAEKVHKYRQLRADRDEFAKLMEIECGNFYFNFFDGGLSTMDIKDSIKLRFLYLCTYVVYDEKGSYLAYDNGIKLSRDGLCELLGLSDRECTNTISALVKNNLLIKYDKYYIVNNDYVKRGKLNKNEDNSPHTRVFDNGLRELYKNCKATQHKQLYYLFKLLPYINLKYNAVCQNPSETIAEDVIPLTLTEMCEVVGYSTDKPTRFKKEMYGLQLFGQYAMLGIENKNGMWYKINPRVLYAGTSGHFEEFTKLICSDFSISRK